MYPKIFNFIDSYTLCILVGAMIAFINVIIYLKKKNFNKRNVLDMLICGCFAIAFGLVFAILFQNFYDFIAHPQGYKWSFKMTFFGGLIGGVIAYLVTYYILNKKWNQDIKAILVIAPSAITLAHAIGRLGCFLAGCCYGKETNSIWGIYFPNIGLKVFPTQLYEMGFLLILSAILLFLTYKFDFKYTFVIYLISYSIFRFLIEFLRGDDRGFSLFGLSPSQIISILLLILSIPLFFFLRNKVFKDEKETNN